MASTHTAGRDLSATEIRRRLALLIGLLASTTACAAVLLFLPQHPGASYSTKPPVQAVP